MTTKFLYFSILLSVLTNSVSGQYCTNDSRFTQKKSFDSTAITIASNVQFGTAPDHLGNPYALRMDLYYPNLNVDPLLKRPFVMLMHGGGFSSGDKQSGDIKDLCFYMAMRGFVCASVNYRLGYNFTEYGQYKARYRAIQDAHAAMRYIVNSANTVRIDTSWLFVGGQSAGALVAMGLVYGNQSEFDNVSLLYNSTAVSAELGNLATSGNTLTNTYRIKGVFNNWGAGAQNEIDVNEMLPTIAFHDVLDTVVKIDLDAYTHYAMEGSRIIHNKLILNGVCSELTVDSTRQHGIYRNASSVFRAQRASCFFKSVFCGNCSNFFSRDSIPSNCSALLQSINQNTNESAIQVYPNPGKGSILIKGVDEGEINLYNLPGELIYTAKFKQGETLNLGTPGSGLYILTISHHKNLITTRKLLIE